jgi:anti-sigma-K factor RskA
MSELDDMDDMSCDEFAEVAAELALGVLTGRERAAALAHLGGCESCREHVRELTMVGDELLALLPPQEPSAGFESRVLDRLGLAVPSQQSSDLPSLQSSDIPSLQSSDVRVLTDERAKHRPDRSTRPAGRPRTRLSRRLLTAAAVAVALIGGGVGWGLRDATAPVSASSATSALSTAAFVTSDHQTVGQAFVYNSSPWWTYMTVNMEGLGDATVTCQLEEADGHFKDVGEFRLADGFGSWGSSPYTAGPGTIMGARLLSADGTVLATATFH